jgi:DNA gyrase subunit B
VSIENVRKRPGMYIGGTDAHGLHHLLWEVVGNCVDQHLAGRCGLVEVALLSDGWVQVSDDGPGMSLDAGADGRPFVERVFCELHHDGTEDGHFPHAHVGLHGVGVCVVNALSEHLEVEIHREGRIWTQTYGRGVAVGPLTMGEPTLRTGTTVRFRPDPHIFNATGFSFPLIRERLLELAALSRGLRFQLRDEKGLSLALQSENGLADLLPNLAHELRVREGETEVVALWHSVAGKPEIHSFVNLTRTNAGSHVDGMLAGLADSLRRSLDVGAHTAEAAVRSGLAAAVHVILREAKFGDPTGDRLDAPEVARSIRALVAQQPFPHGLAETLVRRIR